MKKKSLLITLACSTLLLTSCDKIQANLPNKNDSLVDSQITLDHNTLDTIYETIKGGDSYASTVSDLITAELAKVVLGDFDIVANEEKILVKLNGYDDVDATKKQEFIKNHPAYNNWESSSFKLVLSKEAPSVAEFEKRLSVVKGIIEKQVISTIWTEANTSSYKRNNRFYEVLYARNQVEKLYKVTQKDGVTLIPNINELISKTPSYNSHYINLDDDPDKFNGFSDEIKFADNLFTDGALIDGKYDVNSEKGRDEIQKVVHMTCYLDYINNSVLPTIMKNLLVEQYVLQEQYSAIGSTSSRKVNYIQITNNSEKNGDKFFKKFVTDYFVGEDKDKLSLSTDEKFEIASAAWKGNPNYINKMDEKLKANTTELASAIFGNTSSKNPSQGVVPGHKKGGYIENYADPDKKFEYYKNTPYYNIVNDYSTLSNDIKTNNTTNYTAFTSIDSITYSPIVGFAIKEDANTVLDYSTYGWQTKDSSALPESIKDKLYKFAFVNEWNSAIASEDKHYEGSYLYEVGNTNKFLLRKNTYDQLYDSVLWEEGGSYYLVEVEDVIASSTNTIGEELSQAEKEAIEAKSREAAYTLASGSTYTNNALTFYLEQCNIDYHDQDVYDYFKTTFPSLFE